MPLDDLCHDEIRQHVFPCDGIPCLQIEDKSFVNHNSFVFKIPCCQFFIAKH